VVGRLTIQFLPWGEGVEIPIAPPQGLALLLVDQDTGDEVILDIYGSEDEMAITKDEKAAAVLGFQPTWESAALTVDFAAPLSQGEYWLQMVLIDDIRWETSAYFGLLAATPYFSVAPEGCTYIGNLFYSYYRVAPGDQPALVGQMGDDLGLEELYYSEHEDGSFVGESADFSIPSEDEQPAQAAGCQTRPVFFEPSS